MKNLYEHLSTFFEVTFQKWTAAEKRLKKKSLRKAHRGTNWKQTAPRKGMKRVKLASNRYIRIMMTPKEKQVKRVIGKQLGTKKHLRR